MKYVVMFLFAVAVLLYAMGRGCEGRGPDMGILGLMFLAGSFLSFLLGLLGSSFLVGRYFGRRSTQSDPKDGF